MNKSFNNSSRLAVLCSLSLGICLFLYKFGFRCLNPTNLGFIFRVGGDLSVSYLGWAFFRESPWSFPFGQITGYLAPFGTYISLLGADIFLAIPFKLLSPFLPSDFQYFGWLLLAHYCLQAYFGYRLMRLITPNLIQQVLGVCFFLLSPPLLWRITQGHLDAGCHWMILAAFTIYFENYSSIKYKHVILWWSLLIIVSFSVFTYMGAMVLSLALAFSFGHLVFTPASRLKLIGSVALYLLLVVATFASLGYFNSGISAQYSDLTSYTTYSLNLNFLINPLEWSAFIPALPYRLGQLEGFNYLGLGIIILVGYSIIYLVWQRPKFNNVKYLLPFLITLLLIFIYAISNKVTWSSMVLFKYPLPEPLLRIANILRVGGRFGWQLFYAILYGALFCVVAIKRRTLSIALMSACLLIQVADIHKLLYSPDFHNASPLASPLKSPAWQSIGQDFDKIIVYPPFLYAITNLEDREYFMLYSLKHHLSINMGGVGRLPLEEMKIYQEELKASFRNDQLDPKAIYVFADPIDSETLKLFHKWDQCALVDGYIVYTTDGRFLDGSNRLEVETLTFLAFLKKYEGNTMLIAAREYLAPALMPEEIKQYLLEKGSKLPGLGFRGSYVGVFSRGEKVVEKISDKSAVKVEVRRQVAPSGGQVIADQDIELYSAGVPFGNKTSIKIAGVEHSKDFGGLDIVAIDRQGNILASTVFGVNNPNSTTLCHTDKSRSLEKSDRLTQK
ncbi:MAG: DUF6311 domain-containing protein [Desulfobaccales bacterium]